MDGHPQHAENAARSPLRPDAAQAAWCLTEAANEPFFTLVQRYIFPPFFVAALAAGSDANGAATWGYVTSAAGLLVAIGAPLLGAMIDSAGRRRPALIAVSLASMIASAVLWWATPGSPLLLVALAAAIAITGAELLAVITNAWLPQVARFGRAGTFSGIAFGLGQLAGIASLVLVIALSDELPKALAHIPFAIERLAGPIAAVAMLVFLVPSFLFLRDIPRSPAAAGSPGSLATLWLMCREAAGDVRLARFYIGRAIGGDGMSLMFAFGAVLAGQLFGWKAGTLATFGVVVTVAAASGGFLSVVIDKWLGARRTVITGMAIVLAGSAALLSIGSAANAGVPFGTLNEKLFTAAALLIALGSGPAIAGMRALMAEIAPPGRATAAFGLYAFSGRATNFIGPLVLGLIVSATGSLRAGLLVALVFLLIGIGYFIALPADNRSEA